MEPALKNKDRYQRTPVVVLTQRARDVLDVLD